MARERARRVSHHHDCTNFALDEFSNSLTSSGILKVLKAWKKMGLDSSGTMRTWLNFLAAKSQKTLRGSGWIRSRRAGANEVTAEKLGELPQERLRKEYSAAFWFSFRRRWSG